MVLSFTVKNDTILCDFALRRGFFVGGAGLTNKEKTKMAHKIAADKCVGCGCCKEACPAEAITEGTPYAIDPAKCVDCGACAAQCPSEAISAE